MNGLLEKELDPKTDRKQIWVSLSQLLQNFDMSIPRRLLNHVVVK